MQIFLTKRLATAIGVKPVSANEVLNPLFCWTANWINTFYRRKEDMVIMVNNATGFTVTIYGVKRNQFKKIEEKMVAAIEHTLLAMNLNPDLVGEYIKQAGDISYFANQDRKMTSQINRRSLDAALVVGSAQNKSDVELKFDDTMGRIVSMRPVNYSKNYSDGFIPAEKMVEALSKICAAPAYKYRAFELLVTLDLEIYKATRRLIVPADIDFQEFHWLLQKVFDWKGHHLYDFAVLDKKNKLCLLLVLDDEDLFFDEKAVLMYEHKLAEYFPKYGSIIYTYDMGDNWEHVIKLVRVIEEHNEESPYLLEANGQTPPEDVGGVGGFINFREIMQNPKHPEYSETENWARFWSLELSEWETRPKVIR